MSKHSFFCLLSCGDSAVNIFVESQVDLLLMAGYICSPFSGRLVDGNSSVAAEVVFSKALVFSIFLLQAISKVRDSVVRVVTVDVIDNSARPVPMNEYPSDSVGLVHHIIDANPEISRRMVVAGGLSGFNVPCTTVAPKEYSSLWVVVDSCADFFRSMMRVSHDALQKLIGQRPAAIGSRERALPLWGNLC